MSFYELLDVFTLFSPFVLIIALCIGSFFHRFLDRIHKYILLYLVLAFVMDITSRVCGIIASNNLIFIPLFGFGELIILSLFFYVQFIHKKKPVLFVIILCVLVFMIWEIWELRNVNPQHFHSYSRVLSSLCIVLLSISFFFERLKNTRTISWPVFTLNSIVLIFFSLNLIFFLPLNFLVNEYSNLKFYFWFVNLMCTILFYGFLTFSIWKNGKTHKRLHRGLV